MPITLQCPCGRRVAASDKHAGRRMTCPDCGGPMAPPSGPLRTEVGSPAATTPVAPLTPFEQAVIARMDWYAETLKVVAWRLGWVLGLALVLALAAGYALVLR